MDRHKLQTLLQILTLVWPILAIAVFGGVHPISVILLLAAVTLTLLATIFLPQIHWRIPKPFFIAALGLLAINTIQLIPWPRQFVQFLAPKTYDFLAYLLASPGGQPPNWLPAVFTPGETLFSAGRLLLGLLYLLLLVTVFSHHSHKRTWPLWLLAIAGAFSVVVSLLSSAITPGGFSNLYPAGAVSDALFPGTFINSNFQAGFYILATFGALGLAGHHTLHHEQRLLAIVLALFSLCGIALTASRGAILCTAAGLLILAFTQYRHFGKKGLAVLILSTMAATALAYYLAAAHINNQLATMSPDQFNWQQEKISRWPDFIRIIKDFWLFGTGDAGVAALYPHYAASGGQIISAAENIFLDIPLKYGGAGFLLLLISTIMAGGQLIRYREFHHMEKTCLAGLLTWLCHNMVDFNWRSPAIIMVAAILLATLITAQHRHNTPHWHHLNKLSIYTLCTLALLWLLPATLARHHLPHQFDQPMRLAITTNDLATGFKLFQQQQRWSPADSYSYTLYGWQLAATENRQQAVLALHYLNRALFLDDHNWQATYATWLALNTRGQKSQALLQLRLALEYAPYEKRTLLIRQLGHKTTGIEQLIYLGKESTPIVQQQILAFLLSGSERQFLAKAINEFSFIDKAVTANQLELAFKIGLRLYDEKIQDLACEKSNKLYPTAIWSRCCQALLASRHDSAATAITDLRKRLDDASFEDGMTIIRTLDDIYYKNKNLSGLTNLLHHPAAVNNLAFLYYHRGLLYAEKNDTASAIRDWQHATDIQPNIPAWYQLGRYYEKKGHQDLAIAAYRKMLEYHPDDQPSLEALKRLE